MAGGTPKGVFGLEDGVGDKLAGVLVLQAVKHACPVLSGGHEPPEAHFCQVLGHGRRGFMDYVCQPADRQFTIAQGKDDPDPGGVSQHAENLNGKLHILAVGFPATYLLVCIHT